jgi:hypothetical protein
MRRVPHESRRRFLEHLAAEGASLSMLLRASGVMYRAAVLMQLDEASPVEQIAVERTAKRWAARRNGNPNLREPKHTERENFDRSPAIGYASPTGFTQSR